MSNKIFHFVRHHEVAAYERLGWQRHDSLNGTHHGEWSTLMQWQGEGEPVKPFFTERSRETNEEAEKLAKEVAAIAEELKVAQ